MSTASFDTLTYAKMLQEAGFTARQAEVQAEALRAVIDENLATKHDIELARIFHEKGGEILYSSCGIRRLSRKEKGISP